MKLGVLIATVIAILIAGAFAQFSYFDTLEQASNFGESFGGISAFFSSVALALAIYSMILQQKQNSAFEKQAFGALEQQAKQIEMLQSNIQEQVAMSKVTALNGLIDREEQQIVNLKSWGTQQGNPNKYEPGIQAASKRIEQYKQKLAIHAED